MTPHTPRTKVHHSVPAEVLTFLKPEKLGRHYHKVPGYIKSVTNKYARVIPDYFLSQYRINSNLQQVRIHEHFTRAADCRYHTEIGTLGFSIDRPLVAELLERYYGGISPTGQNDPPVSASETRLLARMGIDLCQLCAQMLNGGLPLEHIDDAVSTYEEIHWGYCVEFVFGDLEAGVDASVHLFLDTHAVDELTRHLSELAPATAAPDEQRISQLPVRLDCVLVRMQMPLASVLALNVDDIVMVRLLERCEVHIKQQKLFYATLAEDDGALYLTSLDSVKSP
ncbi:FliM/FliN family flagellar motor switch protein [Pseudomonas helleri]|uniref:Flagellar motor switch protein FliN-like C-terminal domain-containing protein n=2 Tax=Pseudomonas helleri TaxID=1608996 RepID=A0A6A7YWQ5_9PSED|nr:FliM/FliN family flagellar motor switch protein [Pseudomonas helleri]MQT28270.1 hypothetical protein [Pseudomonas helleri]MQT80793.1 hypothetical protein [Pseudomonas helleri]MQU16921.1 hypothetical protein [Pseudomonas helleri]MQU26857.1 hypothetical protein [Pseudomonas helleri]